MLAGACTVSAAIGLVAVAMSGERPPTLVLAVPPALAAAWILLRRRGRGGGA